MKYIAYLEVDLNAPFRHKQFAAIAFDQGVAIHGFSGAPTRDALTDFIAGATAFILERETLLHDPVLTAKIIEGVRNGKRMLVKVDPDAPELINRLLDVFHIEATRIGIYDEESGTGHGRLLEISRPEHPTCFRNEALFNGVDQVTIQQAQVLRYGGEASPALMIPLKSRSVGTVDLTSDLPEDWTSPTIACMAESQPDGFAGAVLVQSGGLFHDSYTGATGFTFPGIETNRRLAGNVIRWLLGDQKETTRPEVEAFDLVDRIERTLVEYVQAALDFTYSDWWTEGVPVAVRKKCAERKEDEGNRLPKAAYIDLIDIKSIVEKNWQVFESDLKVVGWSGGKSAALGWLGQLNDLRKFVMHPTKGHFSRSTVTSQQLVALRETASRTSALLRRIERRRAGGESRPDEERSAG